MSDKSLAKHRSPHIVSIHVIDDDSLLNIFYLYRTFFLGEGRNNHELLHGVGELWVQGHWWYRLAHVCQRWRDLVLGSASYLRLSLVCTNGTPVENMLAHSPPLPLTVDYSSKDGIDAEDEEGILLALEQRHRVRHLRLAFPVQSLRKLVIAIDEEFPVLEYLILYTPLRDNTASMLPETLQAPNLHHLVLTGFACPIRPQLHPTTAGLVTLCLVIRHSSAYFKPNILLQWISFMPQLENLKISFTFPVPNRDVARQLTLTPITTHITLPNLRLFVFRGVSTYLEAVVCRITAPRLKNLQIAFFKQLTFSVPRLSQFINTTENLRFDKAVIKFYHKHVSVLMYFREADTDAFGVAVDSWHLDWQVSSVAQISDALSHVFSATEHLTLEHGIHGQSSEEHNEVDRIEWRKLLGSFSNVKTLRVKGGLVEQLSSCLRFEDGEHPLELLPELQKLMYPASRDARDAFTSFIDARENAGRPVTLVRHSTHPAKDRHARSFPSPASSTSPSPGPSTPPPLPNVAFPFPVHPPHPRVYTPSPPPQPHALPHIPPAPMTPGVYIHPALAAPSLLYDMRSHPSHSNPRLSPAVFTTPASYPRLPSLALCFGDLPWPFAVIPDAEQFHKNVFVTVQDVLLAIYVHLCTAVKRDEYEAMSKFRKAEICRAFESRVGTDAIQRGKGIRRIDFLGGRYCAQGFVRSQFTDSVWDVVIH